MVVCVFTQVQTNRGWLNLLLSAKGRDLPCMRLLRLSFYVPYKFSRWPQPQFVYWRTEPQVMNLEPPPWQNECVWGFTPQRIVALHIYIDLQRLFTFFLFNFSTSCRQLTNHTINSWPEKRCKRKLLSDWGIVAVMPAPVQIPRPHVVLCSFCSVGLLSDFINFVNLTG